MGTYSLSVYGSVEEIRQLRWTDGTTHEDYALNVSMNREEFRAIPHMLTYNEQQIMVVVVGMWSCEQLVHLAKFCPQKNPPTSNNNNVSNTKDKSISPITWNLGTIKAVRRRDGPRSLGKRNIYPKLQHQKQCRLQE